MQKLKTNKLKKDYDKNKESSYPKNWDVNNLYHWTMLQKLPVNKFVWIEDASQFNEDFTKGYNEASDEGYLLEVHAQCQVDAEVDVLKNYMKFIMIYYFYQRERKLKIWKRLFLIYMIKLNMLFK